MRKGFGGKQLVMRESKIESAEYLGQFGGLLSVGASQTMNFVPSDAGPYWMTEAEKHSNRKDRPSGKKIKRFRNKGDLLKERKNIYILTLPCPTEVWIDLRAGPQKGHGPI
jgi:hypothetical protein